MQVSNRTLLLIISLIISFQLLVILPVLSKALAITEKERVAKLIEGAKREEKLVGYGHLLIGDAVGLAKEFEKIYPFIKVEYTKFVRDALLTKTIMEVRNQVYIPDFMIAVAPVTYLLKKESLLRQYTSPEAEIYPKKLRDHDGYWVGGFIAPMVLMYNTKLVTSKEAPASFEDLLDPKWKGRIGLTYTDYEWFNVAKEVWGEKRATSFLKKLTGQKLSLRSGGRTLAVQLLAAGEFSILLQSFLHTIPGMKKDGASIEWIPGEFSPLSF